MWFEPQTGVIIGWILGGVAGLYGCVFGTLAGLCARRGMYQKPVLTVSLGSVVFGAVTQCTGLVALIFNQPRHVWYPFTVIGLAITVCFLLYYTVAKKIYANADVRNKPVMVKKTAA